MANSRKTSYDLVLDPPVSTHKLRVTILSAYSLGFNGLALIRLWHMNHMATPIMVNPLSMHFPTYLVEIGTWGPWEFCSGVGAIGWRGKSDPALGITGEEA